MARLNDTIVNGDLRVTGDISAGDISAGDISAGDVCSLGIISSAADKYVESGSTYNLNNCGLDMNNSDIVGCNSILFEDGSEGASEGIQFYHSTGKVNSLWCTTGGTLYFTPERTLGSSSTTGVFSVNNAGDVSANTYTAQSDKRLKENIISYACEKSILDLPVYEYNYIKNKNEKYIGCLAQDLQEICPEIVTEGDDGYLRIQESKIVYLLLEEVKKLKQEVEELKKKS